MSVIRRVGGSPAHAVKSRYCSLYDCYYCNYHRVGGEPAHPTEPPE